jgi:2-polyprenyl-6-methoxyphenol hydroxylase-like FAD-dependent oxidoreductase
MVIDFLIVGGGIGGAVLARLLTRRGKRVVVVEKGAGPPKLVRPEVLWPVTVELLRSLLSAADLDHAMIPARGVAFTSGSETRMLVTPEVIHEAGVQPMSTDPSETRARLLGSGEFELHHGMEVIRVLKERERVVGARCRAAATGEEREFQASWTVGDDGAHSLVREACGIDLEMHTLPLDLLCFGFSWPPRLAAGVVQFWLNRHGGRSGFLGMAAFPLPGGKGAGLVPIRPGALDEHIDAAREGWDAFMGKHPDAAEVATGLAFPDDMVRVRRPWGHAERYGSDGAVLLGDAVHPVSPAGGQGANMSVADARVLAELADLEPAKLVSTYEERRRAANERSIAFTRRAAQFLGLPFSLVVATAPISLGWLSRRPQRMAWFLRQAAAAFQDQAN